MSLLFVDSFDHYPNIHKQRKWINDAGQILIGEGRRGSNCWIGGYTQRLIYGFPGETEVIVGFAFKGDGTGLGTFGMSSHLFYMGFDEYVHFLLYVTDPGAVTLVQRGYNSTGGTTDVEIGRTREGVIHVNEWNYIEIKIKLVEVGEIAMAINEEVHFDVFGDFRPQPVAGSVTIPNSVNWIGLGSILANTQNIRYDDLYLCNTAGSMNNDFLGDVRVDVVYPIANASPIQFTPSEAADNYTLVNETQMDLTNYVYSNTVGAQDIYSFGDVTTSTDEFIGIQINATAKKSDAGLRKMKILTKSGGVVYKSGDYYMSESSFIDHLQIREVDPATGLLWTDATISAALFGVEVA